MYKLTVIIPVYNGESTIQKCFDSLFNQTIGFDSIEVIFVDDCSTDKSWDRINELSAKHTNVFGYKTDKTSGASGKPRNIGIKHSSAPYIMFLDVDDIYFENACEILYDIIMQKDVDLVSGNYMIFDGEEINSNKWDDVGFNKGILELNKIDDSPNIMYYTPAVWSKIYKKSFLNEKNLRFEEGIPAQDLIFVSQTLLEANGIIYVDKPIVNYTHIKSKGGTISTSKDKKTLSKFIDAYTVFYNILEEKYPSKISLCLSHFVFFTKQLVTSSLPPEDIWDLLLKADFLIKKHNSMNHVTLESYNLLYKLVEEKNYPEAIALINLIRSEFNGKLDVDIKSKEILLLFFGFDYSVGGLCKAVLNRANLLAKYGHNVSLINIDSCINYGPNILENGYKNINNIEKQFRELGYLSDNVNFFNIFEYYREKNTITPNTNINLSINEITSVKVTSLFVIQNVEKSGGVKILNFFDRNDFTDHELNLIEILYKEPVSGKIKQSKFSEIFNKKLIRTENYVNNILNVVTEHGKKDLFYTSDGFIYLKILKEPSIKYILCDRKSGFEITFNNLTEFCDHFIEEMCLRCSEKPFLFNESSGDIPSFNNVPSEFAYKIGYIHSNPYNEKPHCYGSSRRVISALDDVKHLDALITLTESEKNDLIKEFNTNNIYAIPNIINIQNNQNYQINKDFNKISIFARISPEKNLGDLVKAFKLVHEKNPKAMLNIYGRALNPREIEEYNKLKNLIHSFNLDNNILFKGHVNNVYEEMRTSLATTFVSEFEGMGMVVLESMANKTPVISYKIHYGPEDIITDGKDGFLVNQYDVETLAKKIIYVLDNPDIAVKLGEEAQKKFFNDFSSEVSYNKLLNLLKEVYINSTIKSINEYMSVISNNKVLVSENNNLVSENNNLVSENNNLVSENNKVTEQNIELNIENGRLIEQNNQWYVQNNKLSEENKHNSEIINNLKTSNDYYRLKNNPKKRLLLFLPYLYILFKAENIFVNIKLYRKLVKNKWFDIGFYLNNNPDISHKKWCKILTPETHYVCHGFDEKRFPNSNYKNNLNKKDLINKIDK